MAINLSSPVTGAPQTGLTSPAYTLVQDKEPVPNSRQWVVSALGGTQPGVDPSCASAPFTITVFRPAQFKPFKTGLNAVNSGKDVWSVLSRVAVAVDSSGDKIGMMIVKTTIEVPAGAGVCDPSQVRAALSAHFGVLNQQSSSIGDSLINGTL